MKEADNRRHFIRRSGLFLAGFTFFDRFLLAGPLTAKGENSRQNEEEISPAEDLMREHGVLKRILLAYQEIIKRINSNKDFPPDTVVDSANIIRNFVEDYHEKLEENHLFPRFKKAGVLVDLVNVLATQHQKGRVVTDRILNLGKNSFTGDDDKEQLKNYLYSFIRMYSPHEAREDTILFPAFKKIVSTDEYDSLGIEFEKQEEQKFGEDGFNTIVDKVADIEKRLNIYDLSQFTPRV